MRFLAETQFHRRWQSWKAGIQTTIGQRRTTAYCGRKMRSIGLWPELKAIKFKKNIDFGRQFLEKHHSRSGLCGHKHLITELFKSKRMITKNLLKALTAITVLSTVAAKGVIVYSNPGNMVGNEQVPAPMTLGMDFQVNSVAGGHVTAMGAFDNGLDGFTGFVDVGIFDVGTGFLVPGTSVTFSGAADPLVGSSRFITLGSPVFLGAGVYSVVASGYGNFAGFERNYNSVNVGSPGAPTFNNAGGVLTMLGHRESIGGGLFMPGGSFFSGGSNPAFGAGTFDFTPVPEAETFALAGVALLGIVYIGRNVIRRQIA